MSDCDAVANFKNFPGRWNGSTDAESAAAAIRGGLDVDCGETYGALPSAVAAGLVSERDVRRAARRFLTSQIRLGYLDRTPFDAVGPAVVDSPAHRKLALEAAEQGLVLLRNEAPPGSVRPLLPLLSGGNVALVGPHADSTVDLLGNYHGVNLQVLNRSFVTVAKQLGVSATHADGDDPAVAARLAAAADTAVLFLGLHEADEGEGHDRTSLELPPAQTALARAVLAAQPRTAVVLVNGGPLAISGLVSGSHPAPAVIEAFYPAQMGAEAVIRALFGHTNQFGKLPYTVYAPGFAERDPFNFDLQAGDGLTYRYYRKRPLFPFGHGLSYTTFAFEWAAPPPATVSVASLSRAGPGGLRCSDCSRIKFAVRVTNTGGVTGDAVVLGFVTNDHLVPNSTHAGHSRQLFDFARAAAIPPGGAAVITLQMDSGCKQAVSLVGDDGIRRVQPGAFTVTVGDGEDLAQHTLTVTGISTAQSPKCPIAV